MLSGFCVSMFQHHKIQTKITTPSFFIFYIHNILQIMHNNHMLEHVTSFKFIIFTLQYIQNTTHSIKDLTFSCHNATSFFNLYLHNIIQLFTFKNFQFFFSTQKFDVEYCTVYSQIWIEMMRLPHHETLSLVTKSVFCRVGLQRAQKAYFCTTSSIVTMDSAERDHRGKSYKPFLNWNENAIYVNIWNTSTNRQNRINSK